jgi:hypothetical protein
MKAAFLGFNMLTSGRSLFRPQVGSKQQAIRLIHRRKMGSFCEISYSDANQSYFRVGFLSRTPTPPPLSSMNSTPAASSV